MGENDMTKPVTVQKVSGILRKAGFRQSTSWTTAIRGWRDQTLGFRVRKHWNPKTAVAIDYAFPNSGYSQEQREKAFKQLAAMKIALEAKGAEVTLDGDTLICTSIKEV